MRGWHGGWHQSARRTFVRPITTKKLHIRQLSTDPLALRGAKHKGGWAAVGWRMTGGSVGSGWPGRLVISRVGDGVGEWVGGLRLCHLDEPYCTAL